MARINCASLNNNQTISIRNTVTDTALHFTHKQNANYKAILHLRSSAIRPSLLLVKDLVAIEQEASQLIPSHSASDQEKSPNKYTRNCSQMSVCD
jgi:hypothetical protein